MTKRLFIIAAFMTPLASPAESVTTSVQEVTESSSQIGIKPTVSVSGGSTNNAIKLENGTGGSYGLLSPSISFEYYPNDSVAAQFDASANLKEFSDKTLGSLANEKSLDTRGAIIWFVDDAWETGGDIGFLLMENRLPVQTSSSETMALLQKYSEPDVRAYLAWSKNNLFWEAGAGARRRDYSTDMIDRGNTFQNDYDQLSGDLKIGYEFPKKIKISLRGIFEEKTYKYRPADFSDGAASPSGDPHPNLKETSNEVGLPIEYKIGSLSFVTTPAIRNNKDRIFGARDSQTLKLQQKVSWAITNKLKWAPALNYSQESFVKFRSQPEADPFGSPLRVDKDLSITSPLKYSLTDTTAINLDYSYSKRDSNYANSSYIEQAISAGFTVGI